MALIKNTLAESATNMAIARLQRYENKLKAELETYGRGDAVSDLIAYANTGKPNDIPGRVARAQEIRTVLAAIPQAMARIEAERNEAMRQHNEVVTATHRDAARKKYKQKLQEFDARYAELARSGDGTAFLKAADEVARLAGEAMMTDDLRKYFRGEWRNRRRGADLARY